MKKEKKKGIKKLYFRFVRWLRRLYNFVYQPHIDTDLGQKY